MREFSVLAKSTAKDLSWYIDNKLINEAVKNYVEDCRSTELLGDQNDEYSTDPLGDLEVLSPFPSFKATIQYKSWRRMVLKAKACLPIPSP